MNIIQLYKSNYLNVFDSLLVGVLSAFIVWYIQFLWNRRNLYRLASKVQGPLALPVIGSAHYFIGDPRDIYKNVMWVLNTYPGISRVWYCHRLFYTITIPEHLEIVLNSPKALAKEELYKYAEAAVGHGLFTAPVNIWKQHRKLIMPTFNQKILDKFVDVFTEQTEVLIEHLKKYSGKKEIDAFEIITSCTLDIICETAMGVKIKAQTSDNKFGKLIDKLMEIVFLRMFVMYYHFDFIFNISTHSKKLRDVLKKLNNLIGRVITEKRYNFNKRISEGKRNEEIEFFEGTKRKAFLDYLLEVSLQSGNVFSHKELRDEVFTFMVAGSDTTASTNCFNLMMLGMHLDIQEKVYDEIISVVGPDRNIEATDLPHLKYLERVIKETLRLFPVGAFIVRAIEDDLDLKDGNILPAGSSAVLGIMYTHRNEKYWKEPLKFDPDRFLPEEVEKRHPCSYIPFSYGPRNCIGFKYAMMAMKVQIGMIVRSYKIQCGYRTVKDIELKTNIVLRPRDGFQITFQKRN